MHLPALPDGTVPEQSTLHDSISAFSAQAFPCAIPLVSQQSWPFDCSCLAPIRVAPPAEVVPLRIVFERSPISFSHYAAVDVSETSP